MGRVTEPDSEYDNLEHWWSLSLSAMDRVRYGADGAPKNAAP